jgi:transcriptional regulator with GAF, ATPase, and Fis domain
VLVHKRVLVVNSAASPVLKGQSSVSGPHEQFEIFTVRGLPQAAKTLRQFAIRVVVLTEDLGDVELTWFDADLNDLPERPAIICLATEASRQLPSRLEAKGIPYRVIKSLISEALSAALDPDSALSGSEVSGGNGWERTLIGESPAMCRVRETIRLVAPRNCTVLISGETGTGKEVVAQALHMASRRADRTMVSVNCAAVPSTLLESEMFGHEKGAFTGAMTRRVGRFESAHKSTIFLDEIGDMPLELQAKILRVLQEREVQRIGGSDVSKIDVRVVAATNRDLATEIRNGRFRQDLYFRLRVVPLYIPPLRERREDIPPLVNHFLERNCRRENLPLRTVLPDAMSHLSEQPWLGNVRELEHAIERAIALSGERETLDLCDFSPYCDLLPVGDHGAWLIEPANGLDFEQVIGRLERSIIQQALRLAQGNQSHAAQMLRLKRSTLVSKVKTFPASVTAHA